jgi:hypothetical protein
MKTIELTGAALDWAVAKCEGVDYLSAHNAGDASEFFSYSTNWAHGGPLIEREIIATGRGGAYEHNFWRACAGYSSVSSHGPTPLIAAMRCFVASKLGDNIEIPEELTKGESK